MIFALACGSSFTLYLHRYTWGFVKADVREEFGWSEVQLGWLDSLFTVSYGFGQIPSGILCDWFGPHGLLGSIIVAWSLSMGLVALAGSYSTMILARLLFGAGQAGCYPTLNKVSKLWFPASVRTSVQGWIATFFGRGGGAVSFVLFGTVLRGWLGFSWRESLAVLVGLGILFGIAFMLLFRNRPEDHPWSNEAEKDLVSEGDPDVAGATRSRLPWSMLLRSGNMWIFFLQQFTSAFADTIYVYWIPLFLLTVKGADVKAAGWMAAIPLVGGAVGGMLGGVLQSQWIARTGNRRWSRSLVGMIGKLLATVFMFVSLGFDSAVIIVSIFFLVKFFGDWSQPAVWGTVTDVAGKNAASVFAAVNTVGSVAGFLAGPVMGAIILGYSSTSIVEAEPLAAQPVVQDVERGIWRVQFDDAQNKNVVPGSLRFVLRDGANAAWSFEVSENNEFQPVDPAAGVPAGLDPIRCRFDAIRGRIKLAWSEQPAVYQLDADYTFREYGSGWNALFIILGLIYLVSSVSWLFVDCTKTLADQEEQDVG